MEWVRIRVTIFFLILSVYDLPLVTMIKTRHVSGVFVILFVHHLRTYRQSDRQTDSHTAVVYA